MTTDAPQQAEAEAAAPYPPQPVLRQRRGKRLTLQTRLMVTIFAIVAGILLVVSAVTGVMLNTVLAAQTDQQLTSAWENLSPQIGISAVHGTAADQLQGAQASPGTILVVESPFSGKSGAVVGDDLARYHLSPAQAEQVMKTARSAGDTTVNLHGLGTFRIVPVTQSGEIIGVLGISLGSERTVLTRMLWSITLATIGGMLVLGFATSGVISRGFRPLRGIAATATRVSRQKLDEGVVSIAERVPEEQSDPSTEVGQVGFALNTLLDHVEDSLAARQRNEETMRRFVADASHELRTPLASIRGYSELSQRDPELTESSRQSLERIEAQSQRMTGLVEDLLLLARLDEGMELTFDMVDLNQLVVEAVGDQAMAGMEHDWGADVGEEPVLVAGDKARLTQVVTNLLANARTHTPEGTQVTVGLRTVGEGSSTRAILTVHDTGPGIAPQLQDTLFARFARADSSRNRRTGGSGLGLSIAKAIVEAHHGDISVLSVPGSTTFTVTLPARPST
ncbi:sensor histidine kinase [Microbacterium amylolyticum]|uniref:histidine kinase n=1 Tax=Microbacterium amylolyticum TaxID=936337 RepID=A0ABS4ZK61_9MICO|nr:ATP-binding protein [Microbacterium amylolyticum]MBP2437684.1 two-component system OmpR family sensor kinase [Microbacterium amylolyticum]